MAAVDLQRLIDEELLRRGRGRGGLRDQPGAPPFDPAPRPLPDRIPPGPSPGPDRGPGTDGQQPGDGGQPSPAPEGPTEVGPDGQLRRAIVRRQGREDLSSTDVVRRVDPSLVGRTVPGGVEPPPPDRIPQTPSPGSEAVPTPGAGPGVEIDSTRATPFPSGDPSQSPAATLMNLQQEQNPAAVDPAQIMGLLQDPDIQNAVAPLLQQNPTIVQRLQALPPEQQPRAIQSLIMSALRRRAMAQNAMRGPV